MVINNLNSKLILRLINIFNSFKFENKASTAVEFSVIIAPFFIIVFFIIQISFNYYLQQMLDISVYKIMGTIRYGVAQENASTGAAFWSSYVAPNLNYPFDQSLLRIDVQVVQVDSTSGYATVNNDSGTFQAKSSPSPSYLPVQSVALDSYYCPGVAGSLIFIQATYLNKNIDPLMSLFFKQVMPDGTYGAALTSTIVFKNEPFSTQVISPC